MCIVFIFIVFNFLLLELKFFWWGVDDIVFIFIKFKKNLIIIVKYCNNMVIILMK